MPGSLKKEDPMNQSSNQQKESICYRVGIDPLELVNWLENLRMWISQTILARLVKEIEDCNKQLKKLGVLSLFFFFFFSKVTRVNHKVKFPAPRAHILALRLACPMSKPVLVTPHRTVPRGHQPCQVSKLTYITAHWPLYRLCFLYYIINRDRIFR